MERIQLVAETREPGKGAARRMRVAGRIPGVVYGKIKPMNISVDRRELEKAVKTKSGMNVLIDLSVKGGDSGLALIRDYQADPFRRDFVHVDFQAISLTDKLDLEIPVILTGESIGVKEGGVIEQLRRKISIRATPQSIPDKIEIDISNLKIGDSVHADEIVLPEGTEFPHAVNFTIVAIVPPAKEEVAAVVAPVEGVVEGAVPAEGAAAAAPGAAPGAAPAAPAAVDAKAKGGEGKKEK